MVLGLSNGDVGDRYWEAREGLLSKTAINNLVENAQKLFQMSKRSGILHSVIRFLVFVGIPPFASLRSYIQCQNFFSASSGS